jgi:hypothetical protein
MAQRRHPDILLDPPPDFAVELLPDQGELTPDHRFVGKDAGWASRAGSLFLRVVPHDARPWVGQFEAGYPSPSAVTTVRTGPRPDLLLVVNEGAGFLVPVGDPDATIELGLSPVMGVAVSPQDDMLVAADFTHLAGFGPEGRRWITEASWDGIELDEVHGGVVRGRGLDAPRGDHMDFAVDVRTGRTLRGVTRRP